MMITYNTIFIYTLMMVCSPSRLYTNTTPTSKRRVCSTMMFFHRATRFCNYSTAYDYRCAITSWYYVTVERFVDVNVFNSNVMFVDNR